MRAVRIIFFCLIVFLSLPEMMIGIPSLANALRAHGDAWSVRHDYVGDALVVLIPGCLAVLAAGFGAFFARKLNWLYFLVAAGLVLLLAVAIPSWYMSPELRAGNAVMNRMRDMQNAVESWGNEHGKLPTTQEELAQAMAAARVPLGDSNFQRGGSAVRYEVKLMGAAGGPANVADRPAVIYYAVDANGVHYWLSGTTLPKPVSDYAVPLTEGRNAPQFVLTGQVEPPSPAVAPAKAKIETKK